MYELKTKISVEKHSPQFLFICMQISDDVVDENQTSNEIDNKNQIVYENETEKSEKNNIVSTPFKKRYIDFIEKAKIDFKQYQYDGVLFMFESEKKNKGGFLFDEMGLGKTISIIILLYLNFYKKTLIVLPPVLIQQWFDTIYEKTGHKSTIFHGKHKKNISQNDLEQSNIVLKSHGLQWCHIRIWRHEKIPMRKVLTRRVLTRKVLMLLSSIH